MDSITKEVKYKNQNLPDQIIGKNLLRLPLLDSRNTKTYHLRHKSSTFISFADLDKASTSPMIHPKTTKTKNKIQQSVDVSKNMAFSKEAKTITRFQKTK